MGVRFYLDFLVDTDGVILEIPYKQLKTACLNEIKETCSMRTIIFDGVKALTGQTVIVNNDVRKSTLFNRLEQAILQDERYIGLKEKILKKKEAYKPQRPQVSMRSVAQSKFVREKLIKKLRRKKTY